MNYRYIVLALIAGLMGGLLQAKTFKPLTIANKSGQDVYVSWGYKSADLRTFLVVLPNRAQVNLPGWDIDRSTTVFVYSGPQAPTQTLEGYEFVVPAHKPVDVAVGEDFRIYPKGLRRLSRHTEIGVNCMDPYTEKVSIVPVRQCSQPATVKFTLINSSNLISDIERQRIQLQEICNKIGE